MLGDWLTAIGQSWPFLGLIVFIAGYPLLTACMWIATSLIYMAHRERSDDGFYNIADCDLPTITILVPAYNEGVTLDAALERMHHLDYPAYQVLVIDDGSSDGTAAIARRHTEADERFRLLRKEVNEGKAMAMNDAMPLVDSELVVVVDADAGIRPDALRYIAAHFVRLARVAAVTGNPRVANREGVLTELQTLEFTSIVSVLRRAQVVWGRVLTVSGVISAFRTSALRDVGLFDPTMATEDIDVTWRLQRRFYDVRYEPRALVDMTVPGTLRALWRQRRRWALGLVQVLRRHWRIALDWRCRRQWPVLVEATLSIMWAHAFIVLMCFWLASLVAGIEPVGASPFPNGWGMLIGSVCLLQLSVGVFLDRRYDRSVTRALWIAPLYPLVYWALMAAVTVRTTVPALLAADRSRLAQWHTPRAGAVEPSYAQETPVAEGTAASPSRL
ncbi:MAG: glycosyltransferase [Sporichthyaceae bacterium]|nr:glycosyltransferase [Sporichthyaceae bacterium]